MGRWIQMERVSSKKNNVCLFLIEACNEELLCLQEEVLEVTWKHLAQADRIPPPSLIKERFCMMLEKDDYESALVCTTAYPMVELHAFSKIAWLSLFNENAHRFRKDTLIQLMHEVSMLVARSNLAHPVLQNLLTSCNDFLKTHFKVSQTNLTEIVCMVQSETAMKP